MEILLIFTYNTSLEQWFKSGILYRELSLYKKLLEKEIAIKFLTFGDKKDLKYSEMLKEIKIFPSFKYVKSKNRRISLLKSLFLPLKLKKMFKNVDIIKTNQIEGSWIAWLAKILYNKKFIVRGGFEWLNFYILENFQLKNRKFLTYWTKYFWRYTIELISYKLADRIIITNQMDIDFINKTFKFKSIRKKIRLFYNYIDIRLFKPINIEKKDKHILFIGRFNRQKNLINLLKAFRNLEGFTLDLVGQGSEKELLINKANQFKTKINFLGTFPNNKIPEIINQYQIFILPSYYEGNPKVLLEAMSCGVTCIGTDVYGINNIIKHKQTGYLCDITSESIKNAIITLYNNEQLRNKLGTKAREFIENHYSLNLIADKEYLLYKSLLK